MAFFAAGLGLIIWYAINLSGRNSGEALVSVLTAATSTSNPSTATPLPPLPSPPPPTLTETAQIAYPTRTKTRLPATSIPHSSTPSRQPSTSSPTAQLQDSTLAPSTPSRPPPSPIPNSPTPTLKPQTPTLQPPIPTPIYPVVAPGAIPYRQRFGVAASAADIAPALHIGLPIGGYLNWNVNTQPVAGQATFWQMIRINQGGVRTPWSDIDAALRANPGATWLIGNEPDVAVQDNVTPDQYARIYHEAYHYIKSRDPDALAAIAGVAQPTPLRRAYLDIVLETYQREFHQSMPIDIWNVHAFILREEAGSWGAGIPPGMGSAGAMLYEIKDNADLNIFRQNILDFRAWMAAKGYGNRPLAITEYGVLMPADYGFPPEVTIPFMTGTFDFFLTAANGNGYPADGNRLVQWWYWFSLYDPKDFVNSNLYDRPTGTLTPLGAAWQAYVNGN